MRCAAEGCSVEGRWSPALHLFPMGEPDFPKPFKMLFEAVALCDEHYDCCSVNELLDQVGWDRLVQMFKDNDSELPDRRTIRLEFIRVGLPVQVH